MGKEDEDEINSTNDNNKKVLHINHDMETSTKAKISSHWYLLDSVAKHTLMVDFDGQDVYVFYILYLELVLNQTYKCLSKFTCSFFFLNKHRKLQ